MALLVFEVSEAFGQVAMLTMVSHALAAFSMVRAGLGARAVDCRIVFTNAFYIFFREFHIFFFILRLNNFHCSSPRSLSPDV